MHWWFIQELVFCLSCHVCCHYSPQPRLCDTCIKKIIGIVFNINFFFWWENSLLYVVPVIDVLKWPVVLPPMPHLFLHLVNKHVHAFDHCKIPSWHLQVIFCLSLCPTLKLLGITLSTVNYEFYGCSFHCLLIDWMYFGWVV